MIDIKKIRGYYETDMILFSNHALERIITAYYPSTEKFDDDLKTRKGHEL